MEAFKKYKLRLKELDYPNINALTEEEITDIFSPNNRSFLLTWIIQKLNPETMGVDAPKLSKIAIGDYFCKQGLCNSSQRQLLEGNSNINEQLVIFDRTFEHLSELKNSVDVSDMETIIQYEDVVNFLRKDVNLFPCFGSITKYTPEKRENILLSCKQQIGILSEKQNTNLMNFNQEIDFNDPLFDNSDSNRRESLKKFINNLNGAVSMMKLNKEEKSIKIKESIAQDLEKCCLEMDPILQYFKSINLSHEIQEKAEAVLSTKTDDDFTPTLKQYAETFCVTAKLLQQNM